MNEFQGKTDLLLIIPPGVRYNTPPLGFMYIAASAERSGFTVRILDAGLLGLDIDETMDRIRELQPDLIGLTATTPEYLLVRKFAALLKAEFSTPIVLGGPHATLASDEIASDTVVDFIVRGEGEYTIVDLLKHIKNRDDAVSVEHIAGLSWRTETAFFHNREQVLIKDLDKLPLPARHLIEHGRYRNCGRVYKRKPVAVMVTSRGCPFGCIFCANHLFGKKYRFASAQRMIEEIEMLINDYGVKEIFFREDNFTANRRRTLEFCRLIREKNLDISWMCLADANSITYDLAVEMKAAGCWHVAIGVESGNQEIQKVLKKNLKLDRVRQTFSEVQRAGLKTLAFFMIGNLVDTRETILETIKFANQLDTDFATFTITAPFPRTELYYLAKERGLILDESIESISNNPSLFKQKSAVLATPTLTPRQLRRYQLMAILRFYLRPRQLFRILRNRYLARAFLSIEPSSYSNDEKILRELDQRYEGLTVSALNSEV